MKFKNYAPALLASGIVGFVLGIGAFSFYVNKPFEDMGSLPEWIGALTTIVAGVWAYLRFRKDSSEKPENIKPRLDVSFSRIELSSTDYDEISLTKFSTIESPTLNINIHNPTIRPMNIKDVYIWVFDYERFIGKGFKKIIGQINDLHALRGSNKLELTDYLELQITFEDIKDIVGADNTPEEVIVFPVIVLSDNHVINYVDDVPGFEGYRILKKEMTKYIIV